MSNHHTEILTVPRTHTWYPICRTCGWVGTNHPDDQAANSEADEHLQETHHVRT